MSMDKELERHYVMLLGVGNPWEVKNAELKLVEKKVEIELGWQWGAAAQSIPGPIAPRTAGFCLFFRRLADNVGCQVWCW